MILVKDLSGLFNVGCFFGELPPREFQTGIEVGADQSSLGRPEGLFAQVSNLLIQLLPDLI